MSTVLGQRKSMCQGPQVEGSSVGPEQSCKASKAESRGRNTGLKLRRLGNRRLAKDFQQERDPIKPMLLESSFANSEK